MRPHPSGARVSSVETGGVCGTHSSPEEGEEEEADQDHAGMKGLGTELLSGVWRLENKFVKAACELPELRRGAAISRLCRKL